MASDFITATFDTYGQANTAAVDLGRLSDRRLDVRIGAMLERDSLGNVTTPDVKTTFPFVMIPLSDLLARHPRHRAAHADLLADIVEALAHSSMPAPIGEPAEQCEELSESEMRVLRYLPSNLTAPEIASELCLSTSTVKTHMRHIYAKLGAHRRLEAVDRARTLGLLGRSVRGHH